MSDTQLEIRSKSFRSNIRSHEVEVCITGCDFVFEKSHHLPTLEDRKILVLSQKHLPNVLPAADMTDGTGLSNLTQGILQNLEEHELYIYQLKDEIDLLKAKLREQAALIDQLINKN